MSEALIIDLDPAVYSPEAVLATSYHFADRCVIKALGSDKTLRVSISSPRLGFPLSQSTIDEIVVRLTDEELRARLRKQFAQLETAVVSKAFAAVQNTGQGSQA